MSCSVPLVLYHLTNCDAYNECRKKISSLFWEHPPAEEHCVKLTVIAMHYVCVRVQEDNMTAMRETVRQLFLSIAQEWDCWEKKYCNWVVVTLFFFSLQLVSGFFHSCTFYFVFHFSELSLVSTLFLHPIKSILFLLSRLDRRESVSGWWQCRR